MNHGACVSALRAGGRRFYEALPKAELSVLALRFEVDCRSAISGRGLPVHHGRRPFQVMYNVNGDKAIGQLRCCRPLQTRRGHGDSCSAVDRRESYTRATGGTMGHHVPNSTGIMSLDISSSRRSNEFDDVLGA